LPSQSAIDFEAVFRILGSPPGNLETAG